MHEHVKCPRCGNAFECQVGNISQCQCMAVKLNDDERAFMSENFNDCLCAECMTEVKSEFYRKQQQEKLNKISTLFKK